MKRAGFTMIELIFVIVILGILAAVAVPKLAATRTDAALASAKSDIGTITQAIPAWFQGQRDMRILNATSLDTSKWLPKGTDTNGKAVEEYTLSVDGTPCVVAGIYDVNSSASDGLATGGTADSDDWNTSDGHWISSGASGSPMLRITKHGSADSGDICKTLWASAPDGLGVVEANITMGGKAVQW